MLSLILKYIQYLFALNDDRVFGICKHFDCASAIILSKYINRSLPQYYKLKVKTAYVNIS